MKHETLEYEEFCELYQLGRATMLDEEDLDDAYSSYLYDGNPGTCPRSYIVDKGSRDGFEFGCGHRLLCGECWDIFFQWRLSKKEFWEAD